jgi:hypothetical protein
MNVFVYQLLDESVKRGGVESTDKISIPSFVFFEKSKILK